MSDSPAHGLQRIAEKRDAGLVAVGVTHRRGSGRIVPGSVAEHLLHGAPCPVLVVPAGGSRGPIRSIGVAFDPRPEAKAALVYAADLAQRLGARLTLISVLQPSLTYGAPGAPIDTYELDEPAREALEKVVEGAASDAPAGIETRARVIVGAPGLLLEEAGHEGVDLLVSGSRGYGPMKSVLLGSVSRQLVDHATCPVLVVPRSQAAVAEEPSVAPVAETV
jgi:nucleotide-binding universal stress UspA family protein